MPTTLDYPELDQLDVDPDEGWAPGPGDYATLDLDDYLNFGDTPQERA